MRKIQMTSSSHWTPSVSSKLLDINELAKMLAFELQGNVKQIPVSGDHLSLMQQS